jgi:hypothetical protein
MGLTVKKGGVYTAPVAVFAKKGGVYAAVASLYSKKLGAYQSALAAAIPVIVVPTAIGTPATYTTPDTVLSQQWTLDGVDVSGATSATYTQAIADSSKALRVRDTTGNGSATSLPILPGVQNLKLSNTVNLRAMLANHDGIIMSVGDSFIAGMASGGTGNSDAGARANSFMARMAGKLTTAGFPASKDSAFGGSSTTTVAAWTAFDPRYAITGSTSVLADTTCRCYGGPALYMATVGDTITFTPGTAFDTVDIYYLQTTSSGGAQVRVDASSTVLATLNTTNATKTLAKATVTCPAGSTSVKITMSAAAAHYHAGFVTRVAASPTIQLYNGGRSGETCARLFSTPDNTNNIGAFVARQMLANTAAGGKKIVLLLNGWYNDYNLNQASMTPAIVLSFYRLICDQAVALGIDIWYVGYADTSGAGMTDTVFNSYETAVVGLLRDTYNAVIFEEKFVFTSYATYQPLGYYGDTLHLSATGHDKVADSFTALCQLAASGNIAA